MIRVLIADDEAHARERLKTLFEDYPDFIIVKEVENGDQLIAALINEELDLAFLDINMPGTEVFKTLGSLNRLPSIVFQTAYSEHAVKAFEIEALDYIMKPVSRERFSLCIDKVKKKREADSGKENSPQQEFEGENHKIRQISVKHGSTVKVIKLPEIIKIEVDSGLSFIYTGEGRWLADKSLNFFENILDDDLFFRISRNAIINLSCVKELHPMFKGSYVVELNNKMKLPISRRRMKALREKITFL